MKAFKITDLLMQLALATGFCVYALLNEQGAWMLPAYFAVGGWQVVSMVAHQAAGYAPKGSLRYNYHRFVLGLIVFCVAGSGLAFLGNSSGITMLKDVFGMAVFAVLGILLFAAPVMAVAYWAQCLTETRRLFSKPQRIFA